MASKIKLFSKIGVGKKHKAPVEVTPPSPVIANTVSSQHIEDCVDYSLPPDCGSDDGVYCEPADSLNPGSPSSTQSRTTSTKETSDSESNTLSKSYSSNDSATPTARHIGNDSRCLDTPSHTDSHASSEITDCTPVVQTDSTVIAEPQLSSVMNSVSPSLLGSTQSNIIHKASNIDTFTERHECNQDVGSADPTNNSADDDDLSALYMNSSQILAAKTGIKGSAPIPKLNPEVDPRNIMYPAAGNEYESPWDLESEIIEVVKQIKNPTSPLASTSSYSLRSQKSVTGEPAPTPTTSSGFVDSLNRQNSRADHIPLLKVDYDSKGGISHKVKQPNAQRKNSSTSTAVLQRTNSTPLASSVLVEGVWREAKSSLSAVSPSSPELTSPAQIRSQSNIQVAAKSGANAATNFIYDRNDGSEIEVTVKYPGEQPKLPFAQPRMSLSGASPNISDQVYENITDAKKAAKEYENDALYDDPWNVEQVQQEIFDQLERQKQKAVGSQPKQRRASEELPNESRKHAADLLRRSRPTDLPSESSSQRSEDTSTRRLLSASSASDRLHKLSPRAVTVSSSGSMKSTSLAGPPQVPQSAPGQAHATKPVLVVHKTSSSFVTPPDRKGSLSSRSGSLRKNYITETTYLSTRNHTFHFSGSYSAPSTPGDVCQHRIGLGVNKNLPLTQQPWYHGAIQRYYAEELLRQKPDGSFLIRESSNSPKDKTLSLKNRSIFRNTSERNVRHRRGRRE